MVTTRVRGTDARLLPRTSRTDDVEIATLDGWTDRMQRWIGLAILAACCIYVLVQLQPRLLFLDTTTAGGDTGAHVWFPAYLRDHLLPHLRVAGWSPDFYAGFPAGQFYFPFPALLVVALDVVLPYNIAFKLVTALGPVLLPVGAYVFARGIRAPRPAPSLFALAATGFLFFKDGGIGTMKFDHHIMGGTLTSTLAGEFSFTIALACALLFLGTFARALDPQERGPMWVPALFFAATIASHLVVGVFAVYAALVIWVLHRPIRTATRAVAIVAVGGLLVSAWALPLAATLGYTTDMRYEPVNLTAIAEGGTTGYFDWMFISEMWFLFPLAIVAIVGGIVYRRRATLDLGVIAVTAGLVFYGWEGLRDVFGKAPAWNLRLLPFWYLSLYLLAALGAMEVIRLLARFAAWVSYGTEPVLADGDRTLWRTRVRAADGPVDDLDDLDRAVAAERADDDADGAADADAADDGAVTGPPADDTTAPDATVVPPPPVEARLLRARSGLVKAIAAAALISLLTAVTLARVNDTRDYLPYWAKYNYTGYEGGTPEDFTQKQWPEYHEFMTTAAQLPPGRMLWEGGEALGAYGTPLALMLIPYWTAGRITTMEGLYYEASATTPYHFMAGATLMQTPSNAVRGLPYRTLEDFPLGVRYLQLMGVRYFAATSDRVKELADANPSLSLVATVPDLDHKGPVGWNIYRVADAPVVAPLAYQPVVVDGMNAAPNWKCEDGQPPPPGTKADELGAWECSAVPWFNDPSALDRPLTAAGPRSWQHSQAADARGQTKVPLPQVAVSNIRTGDDTVSFDVSRTGVPVMVRTSYFPNWIAEGADGPWRATPNFMVVVPTSRHVTLRYATTTTEWLGRAMTVLGVVGVGLLVWWSRTDTAPAVLEDGSRRRRRPLRCSTRSPEHSGS